MELSLIEKEEDLAYIDLKNKELERKIVFVYRRDVWKSSPFQYFQELLKHLKEELNEEMIKL